jgi:very-short-patch-repair endonuclease
MSALEDELERQIKLFFSEQPVREYRFFPPRRWKIDFSWINHGIKLAVEVEGGVWLEKSRHRTSEGFKRDMEKYNQLELEGWMLLRVDGDMIKDGRALSLIEDALSRFTP